MTLAAAIMNLWVRNCSKVENNVTNEFPIAKLVRNDLLIVKITPQIKKLEFPESESRHFEKQCFLRLSPKIREGPNCLFSRASSKVPKTTKKLKFVSNGHGIQGYDPTIRESVHFHRYSC